MAQSGNMRQETDVVSVDLKHSADSHGSDRREQAQIIYNVPGPEGFGFMDMKQFAEDQDYDEKYESKDEDMGVEPYQNRVSRKVIMLGDLAVKNAGHEPQDRIEKRSII